MRPSVLAIGMLLLPTVVSAAFPDVPGAHVQYRAIDYVQEQGIMTGYPNGTFGPDLFVNRAEFMKILVESTIGMPDADRYRNCFPDVTNQWFAPYICFAASQQWVEGYPDGRFQPERAVNMAEALKMLVRSRAYPLESRPTFTDGRYDITAWYAPYVNTASHRGILPPQVVWGYTNETLADPMRRARIAEIIYRADLAGGTVQFDWSAQSQCADPSSLQTIRVVYMHKGLAPLEWNGHRETQYEWKIDFYGVLPQGGTCLLASDMNPYSRYSLLPGGMAILPAEQWDLSTDVPVRRGKILFYTGIPDTDAGVGRHWWELDLSAKTLGVATIVSGGNWSSYALSPDHRYFVVLHEDGKLLTATDMDTGREATVALLDAASPLAYGEEISMFGGDHFTTAHLRFLSPSGVEYGLFDTRNKDADNRFQKVSTLTQDLSELFDS